MFRIQMLCCGKLTCTNTVVVTWPPLNILVNRPCSSWPTLMGRECKRRIIRRQTPYRISVLQFVLLSIYGNVHQCFRRNRCVHKGGKIPSACVPRNFGSHSTSVFEFIKSYLSKNRLLSLACSPYSAIRDSFMSELQKIISNVFLFCNAHCLLLYTHWIPFHLIKLSSHFVGLLFFTSFS